MRSVANQVMPNRAGLRAIAWTCAAMMAGATCLFAAAPTGAGAATLPKSLAKFAHCPVGDSAVTTCLYSQTTSTTFSIGSTTLTSTKPTKLQLGLISKPKGITVVLPTDGTSPLQSPPIPLPGGLLGIPGAPSSGLLGVTTTPQLVGLPTVSIANLVTRNGPGIVLPLDVLVSNPLLGSNCTIASASDPVTLNLTTGTTNPPPPNTPISGATGTITGASNGVITIKGSKLVDNAFSVPGASGCGLFGILDPILDLDKGLPSAAGNNAAILQGNTYTAPATLIRKYLG